MEACEVHAPRLRADSGHDSHALRKRQQEIREALIPWMRDSGNPWLTRDALAGYVNMSPHKVEDALRTAWFEIRQDDNRKLYRLRAELARQEWVA